MQARLAGMARDLGERFRLPVDFTPIERACSHCGATLPMLANTCPECGSQAKPQLVRIAGAALALLLVAFLFALFTVVRWQQLDAATTTGAPADAIIAATSDTDFSWLATAMSGCDTIAKNEPASLHFLVTPLAAVGGDLTQWRGKSMNDKGDGILLRATDALDGLKQASLRIYPADYVFGLTDGANQTVYRWRAAAGVARFSNAGAGAVSAFTVQFRTARGVAPAWGTTFNRVDGSCYWVNPIIGN